MANENESFMGRLRSFLGLTREPPRNDFRNPIWLSDEEDEDDELYTKQNINIYTDPSQVSDEFAKHMQDMFKSFGSMFGDIKIFQNEDHFETSPRDPIDDNPENFNTKSIREHYLKPGYHRRDEQPKQDIDLDGKISSNDISGWLKEKDDRKKSGFIAPFNGNLVPGRSFCQTIITTSVTKSDGTVETKRIIKNGNEVIEETTTTGIVDNMSSYSPGMDAMTNTSLIYSSVLSELASLFKNFY